MGGKSTPATPIRTLMDDLSQDHQAAAAPLGVDGPADNVLVNGSTGEEDRDELGVRD